MSVLSPYDWLSIKFASFEKSIALGDSHNHLNMHWLNIISEQFVFLNQYFIKIK